MHVLSSVLVMHTQRPPESSDQYGMCKANSVAMVGL